MTKQRALSLLKLIATILIVAASIYFTIKNVDFSELGRSFRQANYLVALSIIPVIVLSHFVRAHRWKIMLTGIHPQARISSLFAGVIVGYFMSNIIPRSGEFVRPYVTTQRDDNTTYSSLLGTIIVERFIDMVGLLVIIAAVLYFDASLFRGFPEFEGAIKNTLFLAIALGLVFIVIAPSRWGLRIAQTISAPLPGKVRAKVLDVFTKLQIGFGALHSTQQTVLVVCETALMYILYMLPLYIMFFAVPSGLAGSPSLFDAVRLLAVTSLAYAVAPTPGAFGVFHVTARVATMSMLQFTEADAVAYATIMHFINYTTVMVIGGYYLVAFNISLKDLVRRGDARVHAS